MHSYPNHSHYFTHTGLHAPFAALHAETDSDCILLDAEFDEEEQVFVLAQPTETPSDDDEWDEKSLAETT